MAQERTSERYYFVEAYIEAALWADSPRDDDDQTIDADLAFDTRLEMQREAGDFYDANTADILAYAQGVTQAGHDLWFTRVGHGVGYWEEKGEAAERLDKAAKALGSVELWIGDDGWIYQA